MIIDFSITEDKNSHWYCIKCHVEAIERIMEAGKIKLKCRECGAIEDRSIHIDPKMVYWIDPVTKKYWHESVGIAVVNQNKELLFFERTAFPYVYSVPAGHLEAGEDPFNAANRELEEETGIKTDNLEFLFKVPLSGDSCRRGADDHVWNVYRVCVDSNNLAIRINKQEGKNPVWLCFDKVLKMELAVPVRKIIEENKAILLKE